MQSENIWKQVAIGDVIECYFDHHKSEPEKATRQYRITDIQTRYGTDATPLIRAVPVDGKTGWYLDQFGHDSFSGGYITRIVSRQKGHRTTQRFHALYRPHNQNITRTDDRGCLYGPFDAIVHDQLCNIPSVALTTTIDIEKAWALFSKTRPGFVSVDEPFGRTRLDRQTGEDWGFTMRGWIRVNRKPFLRWLLQNINRMQYRRKELDIWEDKHQKEQYEESMNDLDDAIDRLDARLDFERAHQPDPEVVATFDQDARDEADDYKNGHAFLDEQDRLRKMNVEAHGDDHSERYSVETLMGDDADPRRQGPKTIGDLISINQMDTFLEEFQNSSIPPEKIDRAREILRRVQLSTLYPKDVEQMGLLGAKIDAYDEMLSPKIKDEHL